MTKARTPSPSVGQWVKLKSRFNDAVDRLVVVLRFIHVDVEHLGQLGSGNDEGAGVGKAVDHRVGKKIHDQTEPEDPQRELEQTDDQSQKYRIGDESLTARGGQRRQGCRGHERYNRHRPGSKLPAGAKERRQKRRQQRSIQSVLDGHAGQLRIGHGLRDQNESHGQTGKEVTPEGPDIDKLDPLEERKNLPYHSPHPAKCYVIKKTSSKRSGGTSSPRPFACNRLTNHLDQFIDIQRLHQAVKSSQAALLPPLQWRRSCLSAK